MYGGNSSLHGAYIRRSKQMEEVLAQIEAFEEKFAKFRQVRAQSIEMENKESQILMELSELQNAALGDLVTRTRVIEGALLGVSTLASSSMREF